MDNSDKAIMEYSSVIYYELKKSWTKKSNQQNAENSSAITSG